MATIIDTLKKVEPVVANIPDVSELTHVEVEYDPLIDTLSVYFTDVPVPSTWDHLNDYILLGVSLEDEDSVTGVMIEGFTRWLLAATRKAYVSQASQYDR